MLSFYLSLIRNEEDKVKFEKLYYEYRPLMKFIASQSIKDAGLVEDALQDAFVKIINNLQKLDENDCHKTKGYIVTVIRSTTIDICRKEGKYYKEVDDSIIEFKTAKSNVIEEIEEKELLAKLDMLPEIYRDALQLRTYHNLSEKEIADILGISYANTRKRIQRAREMLANLLDD